MIATEIEKLTALDLKALKQADMVAFHWHDDKGSIVATKRVRNAGPFDDRERKYEFAVSCSFSGLGYESPRPRSCFAMNHNAGYDEQWRTIVDSLRVGDEITLHWAANAESNGYFKGAKVAETNECAPGWDLYADVLYFKVRRGEKRLCFVADVSICPNNTARMIRP